MTFPTPERAAPARTNDDADPGGPTASALECEALVLGGGPAGAAAASVLAGAGRNTILLEKRRFPRYSVGESLLPACFFPLQRIGALEAVRKAAFVDKYSVQFASVDGRVSRPFYFFEHLDDESARTWQVRRAEFDRILLENARSRGARVFEDTRASRLLLEGGRVRGAAFSAGEGQRGIVRAPITLDCTGRDALSARTLGWRVMDPELAKVSLWSYFRGGIREGGLDEGATTIAMLPEKGWVWHIPLDDGRDSVGITAAPGYLYRDGRDPERIFDRELLRNGWIRSHLEGAARTSRVRVTSDYSYRSRHAARDGLVLAGDAFAFLDPVFSSGVFLALWSGEAAGRAVLGALEKGDFRARRFAGYARRFLTGVEAMRKLVYAFYNRSFRFADLLGRHPELRAELTDCLVGNLFRDFTKLHRGLAELAPVPEDLDYGRPLTAALLPESA